MWDVDCLCKLVLGNAAFRLSPPWAYFGGFRRNSFGNTLGFIDDPLARFKRLKLLIAKFAFLNLSWTDIKFDADRIFLPELFLDPFLQFAVLQPLCCSARRIRRPVSRCCERLISREGDPSAAL